MTLQLLAASAIGVAFFATAYVAADFIFAHMKRRSTVRKLLRDIRNS